MEFFNKIKSWQYFNEMAFVVALFLLLWAWKFAIEGLVTELAD